MAEFIEIKREDSKIQNEKTETIEKYNKEPYATKSKIRQTALIQSKVFEQAINILGDNIERMDIEKENKGKKKEFLEKKVGLLDCNVIEKINRFGLNKISSKRNCDRIMDRLNLSLNYHKYIIDKNK